MEHSRRFKSSRGGNEYFSDQNVLIFRFNSGLKKQFTITTGGAMNTTENQPVLLEQWFDDQLAEANNNPEAVAYGIMLRIAGEISLALRTKQWKQKDLAANLGVTEAWISRLLNAPPNMSILKIVKVAMVLGLEIDITVQPDISAQQHHNGVRANTSIPKAATTQPTKVKVVSPRTGTSNMLPSPYRPVTAPKG